MNISPSRQEERKSMLAAGIAYSLFGLSYLFSKMALNVAEPSILLFVRFSVTFVILNLLVLLRVMKLNLRAKNLLGPLLVGILQPVLYFILENYGLKYTTTSFTGLVSSISPIFTAILGVIFLREKPNNKQWFCIVLSIAGVMMVSLGTSSGQNTLTGCLCLLGAYLVGAIYSILVRKLSSQFSAFEMTYIMFTIGFIFFACMTFAQYGSQTVSMLGAAVSDWKFVISCLYLGGFCSVGAYMLANYSLARLPVTRATIFNSFATIVSILSGVIIMKDPFTVTSVVSFVLILAGVTGVNRFANTNT